MNAVKLHKNLFHAETQRRRENKNTLEACLFSVSSVPLCDISFVSFASQNFKNDF